MHIHGWHYTSVAEAPLIDISLREQLCPFQLRPGKNGFGNGIFPPRERKNPVQSKYTDLKRALPTYV
jgi:hypothetical protein